MKKQDFLVEILTEELPPKNLLKLSNAFYDSVIDQLNDAQLSFENSTAFATPRRLAIKISGLDDQQPEQTINRQGPAVKAAYDQDGNPTLAALGFAKSCGVELNQVQTIETKQGEKLAFTQTSPGKSVQALLPEIIQTALNKLPIAKRMRWGARDVSFVRPVHGITMLYGNDIIETTLFDLQSSNTTQGHRFHHQGEVTISKPDDYESILEKAHVIADFAKRKAMIKTQVEKIAAEQSCTAIMPEKLLDEVAALVEWPVAILANFDKAFLETPKESLISAMQEHQKSFALINDKGELAPQFITISNIESNNPTQVIAGNECVMTARLSDAKFFYDQDKAQPLATKIDALKQVTYQAKLGSLHDRTQRIIAISKHIAEKISASAELTQRAAELCKADLCTDMVGEFPELQGTMGRYYALNDNEPTEVAQAIEEHYFPRNVNDELPASTTGITLAIADRIEALTGMFGIDQKPTGTKDPFALRRAAISIIRICIEKQLPLDLTDIIDFSIKQFDSNLIQKNTAEDLTLFFQERYRPLYNDQDIETPIVAAVNAINATEPYDVDKRIHAVKQFKSLPEADALAAANKRVSNILKKQGKISATAIDETLLQEPAEKTLHDALSKVAEKVDGLNYSNTLKELAALKNPIDNFFDHVMVMADDEAIKNNRIALLANLREQFLAVADIALLQE